MIVDKKMRLLLIAAEGVLAALSGGCTAEEIQAAISMAVEDLVRATASAAQGLEVIS